MIIVSQDRGIALNMRYVPSIYITRKNESCYRLMASTDDLINGTTLGEYDSKKDAQTAFDALCRAFNGPMAVAYALSAEDAKRGARK